MGEGLFMRGWGGFVHETSGVVEGLFIRVRCTLSEFP